MPPHILAVFNQLYEELKSMKQQQWTITNYGALILAAIYAVKLPEVSHSQSRLQLLVILAAVVGSGLLIWVQRNMAQRRWRLDEVHKAYFTEDELRKIGLTDKQIRKLQNKPWRRKLAYWRGGLEFTVPILSSQTLGTSRSKQVRTLGPASRPSAKSRERDQGRQALNQAL
jgi:hypothetical protein